MSGGTLISIPHDYTQEKPEVVFDNEFDRYTFVALTDTKGNRTILGTIYLRPLMIMEADNVRKQYSDIEDTLDNLLEHK